MWRRITIGSCLFLLATLTGCVERRYVIEPDPPGALVLVNGQPLGTTPVDGHFVYYGNYTFTLVKDGYETLQVDQRINSPWYQCPPIDFASENLTNAKYPAGTVAMANEDSATTNGSQFFIVYKDSTSGLGASYTPFATVSSGLDIVQNVAKDGYSCQYIESGQSEGGAPKKKVIIESVTIKKT